MKQEVCGTNEECKSEKSESDIASGGGKARNEQAVLIAVRISRLVPTVVHWRGRAMWLLSALVISCLIMCLRWALVISWQCWLGRSLVARCLEKRETHPQESGNSTHKSEGDMKVKNAMTPVAADTTKRLTKWFIRRWAGWLQTQYSSKISLLL